MSVHLILITHQNIGDVLLNTAHETLKHIPLPCHVMHVPCDAQPECIYDTLLTQIQQLPEQQEILILGDLYGATPCNIATKLQRRGPHIRLVTGLNLPMLIRVLNYPELDLNALAAKALSGGKDGVIAC